ncbi:MAG TPA: hypothetical protein VER55_07390 [Ardenticatenaceae bacterium]|nr:hypothetical protein [Ardenticatenaceae bacterium]
MKITRPQITSALAVVLIFLVLVPATAHAYLDPGSGSYLLQVIVAGILSSLFLVKTYWHKIKAVFTRGGSQTESEDD